MTRLLRAVCVVVFTALSTGPLFSQVIKNEETVEVPSDDAHMNAAIDRARETLSVFWEREQDSTADQHSFALRVRITDGTSVEYFWLLDIEATDSGFSGTIDNRPRSVMTVELGQRHAFAEHDISDWMYVEDGKIYGGFTLRAMLHRLPEADAAWMRDTLAFEPQ